MEDKQDFKELIRDRCLCAFLYLPPGVYPDTEIRNFFRWTIDFSVISSSLDFDRLENDYTTWPKFILLCQSASDAADILQQQHGPQGGILYFPCETSSDIPNAWQKHKYQLQTPSLLCSSVPAYASSLSAASFTKFRTSNQVGAEAVVTKRPSIPEKHCIDDQKPPIAIGPIMQSSFIIVSNIPAGACKDLLINYFENTRRSGGDEVVGISYDVDSRVAVIEFENYKVVENVLEKCPHKLMKQKITVENYIPPTQGEQCPMIKVSNIPAGASEDLLINYFENTRKSGGEEVMGIEYDVERRMAVIEFEDDKVIEKVLNKSPHVLMKQEVIVERYIPFTSSTQEKQPPMIKVSNIPAGASEDLLVNYFENTRKSGGDEVKEMNYDVDSRVAVIEFEDNEVVENVLKKCPHELMKQEITVEKYTPPTQEKQCPMIKVSNIPTGTSEDLLVNYFENTRKSGGDEVVGIEYDVNSRVAVIEFEDNEVVERVLQKDKHILQNQQITVEKYISESLPTAQSPNVPMIRVAGIAPGVTADAIENFFENRRKSGGEDVKEVEFDEDKGVAFVTFEEMETVEKVLAKCPLSLNNKILDITKYSPDDDDDGSASASASAVTNLCTLEVQGMAPGTSKDHIENYFLTKKACGYRLNDGDVSFNFDDYESKNVVYITFPNSKDAEAAANRSHYVNGENLPVNIYTPPAPPKERPLYNDRVFVTNVNECTTSDGLRNFLELNAQTDVEDSYPGKNPGTYIVEFEKEPNFNNLIKKCKMKSLDGNYIQTKRIPISNCILVWGTDERTTKDNIENYFDNKRRSGAEGVERVEKPEDYDCFLVYYEDHTVLKDVLARKHTIDGKNVSVRTYHDFVGISEEEGGIVFKIPDPIVIQDMDVRKLMFIKQSQMHLKAIELQLQKEHAVLHLPDNNDAPIRIACSLTPETDNWRNILKVWRKSTRESFHKYMNMLDMRTVPVLQDLWQEVIDKINGTNLQNESILILQNKTKSSLELVGITKSVDNVAAKIDQVIKDIKEEYERKKKQVTEKKKDKPYLLELLKRKGFQEEMEKKFKGLIVKLDPGNGVMNITGSSHDVDKVMIEFYHHKDAMKSLEFSNNFSQAQFDLLSKEREIEMYCQDKLKNKNILANWVLNLNKKSISIYAFSDDDLADVCDIFKSAIRSTVFDVKPGALAIEHTPNWAEFIQDLKLNGTKFSFSVVWDQKASKVEVVLVDVDLDIAIEKIKDYIMLNTIMEQSQKLSEGQANLISKHGSDRLANIQAELRADRVEINLQSDKIIIKGTDAGLGKAQKKIEELLSSIVKEDHSLQKPGISQIMESEDIKSKIGKTENRHQVHISDKSSGSDDDDNNDDYSNNSADPSRGQLVEEVITCDRKQFKYHVMLGDITELPVDVLVNSANKSLAGTGGLAFEIFRKGGQTILSECESYITRNGDLRTGEVFVSGPGNLKCKAVIHAVCPIYDKGGSAEDDLRDVVETTMKEADARNFTSIAFPALGAGNYSFPMDTAAKYMVKGIEEFFKGAGGSSLHDVYLCDVIPDRTKVFTRQLKKKFKTQVAENPHGKRKNKWSSQKTAKEPSIGEYSIRLPKQSTATGPKQSPIEIKLVKGQIAKMRADVLVNTTSTDLNLTNGAVSNSILTTAGAEIQTECNNKYPNGIDSGEVAVTNGYNLTCDLVFHGALPQYMPQAEKVLQDFVFECLKQADSKKKTNIAFPALGTGNLKFPKDLVAKTMFQCVNQFGQDNPRSSLKKVFFVIYEKDMETIRAFEAVERGSFYNSPKPSMAGRTRRFSLSRPSDSDGPTFTAKASSQNKQRGIMYGGMINDIKVKLYHGDLLHADVQAIVNSTNETFNFSRGEISKQIAKIGGRALEDEVKLRYNDMQSNGVVFTRVDTNTKVCFKFIAHVNLEFFSDNLSKTVCRLLEKAEEFGITTIAMPLLGCGRSVSRRKPEEFVKGLNKGIMQVKLKKKILNEIHIVINDASKLHEIAAMMIPEEKGRVKQLLSDWNPFGESKPSMKDMTASPMNSTPCYDIQVFGFSKAAVKNAISDLENNLDQTMKTRKIHDDIIKNLSDQQLQEMKKIDSDNVEITIQKEKGDVKVKGFSELVGDTTDKIHKFLKDALIEKQFSQKSKLVNNYIQWSYIDTEDGKEVMEPYPELINLKIEEAFCNQEKEVVFADNRGEHYIVDLTTMEEYAKDDRNSVVKVIRRQKIQGGYEETPANWSQMKAVENLTVITLANTDAEYQTVEKNFQSSIGTNKKTVVKIERIQNKALYQQYATKRKLMESQNPPGTKNERTLWHGTDGKAVHSINAHGFNRSYCGKNAVAYGDGVYFAVNSQYSAQGHYAVKDASGVQQMYQSKVLTGVFCKGATGMRVPPPKTTGSHIIYDSVVDNEATPNMFVIFHDTQAYPEYLISFKA